MAVQDNLFSVLLDRHSGTTEQKRTKADMSMINLRAMGKHMQAVAKSLGDATLYELGRSVGPESSATLSELMLAKIRTGLEGKNNLLRYAAIKGFAGDPDAGQMFIEAEKAASGLQSQYIANIGNLFTLADEGINPGKYDPSAIEQARAGIRSSFGQFQSGQKLYQLIAGFLPLAQTYHLAFQQLSSLSPQLQASGNPDAVAMSQVLLNQERANQSFVQSAVKLYDAGLITEEEAKGRLGLLKTQQREGIE